jgi:RimK family alpha-L-glutamate ligase
MKITIVAQSDRGWHQQELIRAATERGVAVEVVDIKNSNELPAKADKFGDVVIWRAATGLDTLSERTSANLFFADRPVLNRAVFTHPFTAYKYYQQVTIAKVAKKAPHLTGITTYKALDKKHLLELIEQGKLGYPFIAKPNLGSKGNGIVIVEKPEDLKEISKYRKMVFQNFIQNDGDWRVIVVGGRALGVMRRIAKPGSYLNNVSKGARAVVETRPKLKQEIMELAVNVASIFGLACCGVDIIQDKVTKQLHFMEVNTAPQWNTDYGFAAITGVDVAAEIVDLAISLGARKHQKAVELVRETFDKHVSESPSKAIHYASRMFLWNGEPDYRAMLDAGEADYLGDSPETTKARLAKLYDGEGINENKIGVKARYQYYEKYPLLRPANSLLFKALFARTLYGRDDVAACVKEFISDEELLKLFNDLSKDHDAIRVLSTFAINFFYLVKAYFEPNLKLSNLVLLDPKLFEDLTNEYDDHETRGELTRRQKLRLQLYMLTHAVIGESKFYARKVSGQAYKDLVLHAEKIVKDHYFELTLDCKLELLVASKLVGYHSHLQEVILNEAAASMSPIGNFLIDTYNVGSDALLKNKLSQAEHRSVLFIMAATAFQHRLSIKPKAAKAEQRLIGRMAEVDFPEQGIVGAKARVDSGAFFSSVHAADITEEANGKLSFTLLGGYHESIQGVRMHVDEYIKRPIKNTSGDYEDRYVVKLLSAVRGHEPALHTFTLSNRKNMACPVLLGRTFLKRGYVVDVAKQFARQLPHEA